MNQRTGELMKLFAVCDPGLEPFLEQEMTGLGLRPLRAVNGTADTEGGVVCEGNLPDLCRANLWLRTASRILMRLGEFFALRFVELRRKAHNLPWEQYVTAGQPVSIRVTSHASKLYVKRTIAEQVRLAIADRLGEEPRPAALREEEEEKETQLLIVRLVRNECTISVDASGEHLHRRGYRQAVAKAPLRETLAAGMLLASGWDGSSPLLDPFCGSGTIPIEAALLALHIPPGLRRHFQFQDWPGFEQTVWEGVVRDAESRRTTMVPPIIGSDRDAGAIQFARANAERAGVDGHIDFTPRSISDIAPPSGPGWIVTNPPYGVRTSGSKDLRNLYDRLGEVLRTMCPGWCVAMLATDDHLLSRTRLTFEKGISLNNGGIRVKLARGIVPRRSPRAE